MASKMVKKDVLKTVDGSVKKARYMQLRRSRWITECLDHQETKATCWDPGSLLFLHDTCVKPVRIKKGRFHLNIYALNWLMSTYESFCWTQKTWLGETITRGHVYFGGHSIIVKTSMLGLYACNEEKFDTYRSCICNFLMQREYWIMWWHWYSF